MRLFNLIVAGVSGGLVTRLADVFGGARRIATFSVFFWLQVANFDVFLFLVLHVCYLSFAGLIVCVVSVAPNSN